MGNSVKHSKICFIHLSCVELLINTRRVLYLAMFKRAPVVILQPIICWFNSLIINNSTVHS